ncbi:MAG: hypothetical protein CR217_06145 [Beijerinckiaceae bacterium]|nr:MAG: hypothetical protein CR217_06145 [Beijerinckiaceae bacterium]
MGSLEANIEMVVKARNLPNDRIGFSMPGGSAREEIAITILLSKHQRAKIGEVHRQCPAIPPSLRRTDWQRMREYTASSEAGGLLRVQTQWWGPGGAGELAIGPNIVTSLAAGESL